MHTSNLSPAECTSPVSLSGETFMDQFDFDIQTDEFTIINVLIY
jgi:hypothetical protein